jgi:hypothetical protein
MRDHLKRIIYHIPEVYEGEYFRMADTFHVLVLGIERNLLGK